MIHVVRLFLVRSFSLLILLHSLARVLFWIHYCSILWSILSDEFLLMNYIDNLIDLAIILIAAKVFNYMLAMHMHNPLTGIIHWYTGTLEDKCFQELGAILRHNMALTYWRFTGHFFHKILFTKISKFCYNPSTKI